MVGSDGGWGVGRLGQMLCSCGSFSMICQWFHTDLENFIPSGDT